MHILVWLRHCNRNHLKYSPLIPIIATIFIYSVNFYKHQIILKSILKNTKQINTLITINILDIWILTDTQTYKKSYLIKWETAE